MSEHRSAEELFAKLANCPVQPGQLYHHYKDRDCKYEVLQVVFRESDCELMVVYQRTISFLPFIWTRPLSEWLEEVEYEGKMVPRYQKAD